jgi:hypothetical protein
MSEPQNEPSVVGTDQPEMRLSDKLRRIANVLDIYEQPMPVVVAYVKPNGEFETVTNCDETTVRFLLGMSVGSFGASEPVEKPQRRTVPKRGKR